MTKKTVISKKSSPKKRSTITTSGRMSAGAKAPKKGELRKPAKVRLPKGPIWQWSALETAAAIRSGAISSVEVTEAHIERMRAVNPKLNAVVVDLSEEALKAAKAADQARAKGTELGPLHRRADHHQGKRGLQRAAQPQRRTDANEHHRASDAPVVRNLKKAGAIRHRPDQYAPILVPRLHRQSAARADAEPVGSRYHLRWIIGRRWRRGSGRDRNDRAPATTLAVLCAGRRIATG